MSSPLSMLKKTKRTPLTKEHRNEQKVPFRRNLLREFQTALDTDDSPQQSPEPSSHTSASDASTTKSKFPRKKGAPPSDLELMSLMMQRVTLLEKTVKSQTQEIERRDKKISALERKLKIQAESGSKHCLSDREELERKCQQLQMQVQEMENFLSDYGLIWVGDGDCASSSEDEQRSDADRDPEHRDKGFHMNFDLVLRRIRELNVLAGEGESFVKTTATGAQLAQKEPIRLSLYSNGIVMFEGPFRSYQEPSTQRCMEDLMDGYFPSELHDRFPDGVPFQVHDRRDEECIFKRPWDTFPGEGQAVRGRKTQSSGNKMTTDQFLNKLPKAVIKEGRVIDIRESLRAMVQGSSKTQSGSSSSSSSVVLVDTPALQAAAERPQTSTAGRQHSARDTITLKVRSEDGNHTYIMKMNLSETVDHLRKYLDEHRGEGLSGYDIISAYPQRYYNDGACTLQSYGLTSNATLLLRKKQRSP